MADELMTDGVEARREWWRGAFVAPGRAPIESVWLLPPFPADRCTSAQAQTTRVLEGARPPQDAQIRRDRLRPSTQRVR